MNRKNKQQGPKILVLDIELAPMIVHAWQMFDVNIGLNQIQQDWSILSVAAKWVGDNKVHYADVSKEKNYTNDKKVLQMIWKLMDEADIVLGQNSTSFDVKKLNARFILNGMTPPSSYRQIDTKRLAKKNFAFTSNKLEYLSNNLCSKTKKLKHKKYPGHDLWMECIKGNKEAWSQMKAYNIADVKATEELYLKLAPWGTGINMNVYNNREEALCSECGSPNLKRWGYRYTNTGKYQRYVCGDCGAENKGGVNLLTKEKKASLKG